MDTVLSILLYLNTIHSGGSYTCANLNQLKNSNWVRIVAVETILPVLNSVLNQWEPYLPGIIIIDNMSGGGCHIDNKPPY